MGRGLFALTSKKAMEDLILQKHIMGYLKTGKEYANMLKNQDAISGLLRVARKFWRENKKAIGVPVLFSEKQTPFVPLLPSPPLSFDQSPKMHIIRPRALPFHLRIPRVNQKRRERERCRKSEDCKNKNCTAEMSLITCFSMVVAKIRCRGET